MNAPPPNINQIAFSPANKKGVLLLMINVDISNIDFEIIRKHALHNECSAAMIDAKLGIWKIELSKEMTQKSTI